MASQRTAAAPSPSRIPAVRQPSGQPAPQAQPSPIQRADSGRPGAPQVASRTPGAGTATNTRVASGVPQSAVAPQRVASGVPSSAQPVRQNPSAVPSRTNTGLGTNVAPTRTAVVPVTRQPSGVPASATATNPQPRTRAPTGNSSDVAPRAAPTATNPASAQQRTASGVAAPQQRTPTGQSSTQPSQQAQAASRAVSRARRVSKVIVEKEKKTGYWQEIIEEARHDHPELSQEDVNSMIARCLSLDLVSNWKTRETQGNGPRAQELFQQLERTMEAKLAQCNGGRPFPVPGSGFTKIKNMERQLQTFEAKQDKDQEEEAEKVKAKIADLSKSLNHLQHKKDQEREANRRTMTMEINNLREQMQKAATEPQTDQARMIEENKKMAQKMMRLEAALRQMNEEKSKGVEDNDSAMLKKKLALFEARMKQLEEEKKIREGEENADLMKDKLLLMEEKLAKMERRKSVSLTMMMQQKMQQVEEQLSTLRNTGGGGSSTKIQELEKKLIEMQNTKVNPAMINDPETRALRSHVKKMEEAMLAAERKMEEDRQKLEEERHAQAQKRQREEEAYRKKAQQREQLLLDKMAEMEKRISANKGGAGGGGGGSGGSGMDAAIQKRMEEMEKRLAGGGAFAEQMAAMERRLQESEARLAKEQQTSQILMSVLGEKDGPAMDDAHKDIKIAFLTQSTQDLMKRLEETAKAMDTKFAEVTKKIDTMQFSGGGAPAHQHKSGLSYAEINQKLEEIQKKLFDPDIEERESEQLNIEYEKLISELEGTAEYKAEQEMIAKKWKDENTPLNNAALDRVRGEIAGWTPMKKTAQLKRKPELKFLDFTPDQINKKHVNDFKGVTTQNLTLDEARALYACMPEFRKDQEAQVQFVEQLKNKIEVDAKKPAVKPPPPIQAKKPVVMKKPPPAKGGGGGGDFLAELLQKRKAVG